MLPELPEPYNDRDIVVDITNPGNVAHWAKRLAVSEATLRLLVELHGCQAEDLRYAIRRITEATGRSGLRDA